MIRVSLFLEIQQFKAVENKGLRVDISAPTIEMPSMTMALEKYLKNVNKK